MLLLGWYIHIGYGNQVPRSFWGRLMTYTLGFLSILFFGGVLATAGSITTHLVNDIMHRLKKKVPKPVTVLVWGVLWSLWMVLITFYVISFQKQRLDEHLSVGDGYWLAFITTTTIGFGDYYLRPEGLFVTDLLVLWIIFLIGFVLLSSFLTELSNLLGSLLPNLGEDLQHKLKYAYDNEEVPEDVLRRSKKTARNQTADLEEIAAMTTAVPEDILPSHQHNDNHHTDSHDHATETKEDHEDIAHDHATVAKADHDDNAPPVSPSPVAAATIKGAPNPHDYGAKSHLNNHEHSKESNADHEHEREQGPSGLPKASAPTETTATFINTGTDPSMANALLYHEATLLGPLGHKDPPKIVSTFPGQRWFIVANGVYAKQFTVGNEAKQKFTF